MATSQGFFSFVGKDESRRWPGLANKVDEGQVQIRDRELLPWQLASSHGDVSWCIVLVDTGGARGGD